jgi:hypothetical protein
MCKSRFWSPCLDCPQPNDSGEQSRVVKGGRFGVFVVVPKSTSNEIRVALLWRHSCVGLHNVAYHFVRILRAAEFLVKWKTPEHLDYEYLSPHCCRIGKEVRNVEGCQSLQLVGTRPHTFIVFVLKVFRCYDNRLCYTERHPDAYVRISFLRTTEYFHSWIQVDKL